MTRLVRAPMQALGGALEGIDRVLRRWPVAGVSLLLIALAFGLAMRSG